MTSATGSFFQTRSVAVAPVVTRTALPSTPRPLTAVQSTRPKAKPTAIVLAWDNVLFPTKWMADCVGLRTASKKSLDDAQRACLNNPFIVQGLGAIEQQILDLLAMATATAPVFIHSDQWTTTTIDTICSAFFPRLKACLANSSGRIHIMTPMASAASMSPSERAAWKLSVLEQICSAFMALQHVSNAVHGAAPFKVLMVSADELDLRAAARVQELVARVGLVQSLSLPTTLENGTPIPLVDFHKHLQTVFAALAAQASFPTSE